MRFEGVEALASRINRKRRHAVATWNFIAHKYLLDPLQCMVLVTAPYAMLCFSILYL